MPTEPLLTSQDQQEDHPRILQRYEQIASHLVDDVRAGRLLPGERLPGERELAQRLGVGRASLREALGFLQVEGVVETRRGAGSYVAADALSRIATTAPTGLAADASPAALLDARALLEPAIAREAARVALPDERPLDTLLARMARACDSEDPAQRRAWSDADRDFHRAIAAATGNPVLATVGAHLAELMDQPLWQRLRDDSIAVPGRTDLQLAEHRLIAAAITDGDPEAAEAQARSHITRARRFMALN